MYEAHDALLCIKNKSYISESSRFKLSKNHNLKSDNEMRDLFSDLPEALVNNFYLPYRCSFKAKNSKPLLPEIISDKNLSSDKILEIQAFKGLDEKIKKQIIINENQNKEEAFINIKNV